MSYVSKQAYAKQKVGSQFFVQTSAHWHAEYMMLFELT